MNFDLKTWLIIGLCVIIALLLIFDRDPKPDNSALVRENDSLRVVSRTIQRQAEDLARKRVSDSLETTQTKKTYDSTIKVKDARIAYYRAHPKVIEIIKREPLIDSTFQAYDSAFKAKDERIAELSGEIYNCQKLAQQAEVNFNELIRTKDAEIGNRDKQIEKSAKELRKEERRKKLNAILIPIVAVGAFLVGSSL